MATKIYLAGLISTDKPASLQWRVDTHKHYNNPLWVQLLDPMRGKENLVKTSKDGGVTDPALTPKDIILRDFHDVESVDVILASLNDYQSERPLVGTMFELGWAWLLRKPVVAFEPTNLMRNHPFVKDTVAHYCDSIEEAYAILERHYIR